VPLVLRVSYGNAIMYICVPIVTNEGPTMYGV